VQTVTGSMSWSETDFDRGAGDFIVFSLSLLPFYCGQSWKYIKFWGTGERVGGAERKGWGCREKPHECVRRGVVRVCKQQRLCSE